MTPTLPNILRTCLACSALLLWLWGTPPAIAASSAAVRAYDDTTAETRDFSGQSLATEEFSNAKLEGANFHGADLRGTVFQGSSLKNADLSAADFSDGIAYLSYFGGADLRDTILNSAMLLRTRFDDAKIEGADFTNAVLDRYQVSLLCNYAAGTNSKTGVSTRESLECP